MLDDRKIDYTSIKLDVFNTQIVYLPAKYTNLMIEIRKLISCAISHEFLSSISTNKYGFAVWNFSKK